MIWNGRLALARLPAILYASIQEHMLENSCLMLCVEWPYSNTGMHSMLALWLSPYDGGKGLFFSEVVESNNIINR